jgi:flagellar motor switch protein FliN/FliY
MSKTGEGESPALESAAPQPNLDLLLDIPLKVSAGLASVTKSAADVLDLKVGAVVDFDKSATSPIELYANRKLVARGEVVLVGKNLGIRVTRLET